MHIQVEDAAHLAGGQPAYRVLARKQLAARQYDILLAAGLSPGVQKLPQIKQQYGLIVLAAFA